MTVLGVDSAFPPSTGQLEAVRSRGVTWWGFYVGGQGAYHVWTPTDVANLAAGGVVRGIPIWVPRLDLTGNPVKDAQAAYAACIRAKVYGALCLDTEASMRGNPRLVSYVDGFVDETRRLGYLPIVYGGGNYVGSGYQWWIKRSAPPPDRCHQTGSGVVKGLTVDFDDAGSTFPLAFLNHPPIVGGSQPMLVRFTPSGKGYWIVQRSDGGVFSYGDAEFFGSIPSVDAKLSAPIDGFDVTPTGKGYGLSGKDGYYAFGDAPYLGHP